MRALLLLCINQHTIFEVPSFADSKDMIGATFKKTDYVTLPMPLSSRLSSKAKHLMYSTCIQNLATATSAVPGMIAGVEIDNGSRDTDHAPLGVVCHP